MRRTRGAGLTSAVAMILVVAVVTPGALASSEGTDSDGMLPSGDLASTDAARGPSTVGTGGWQVQSSTIATENGQQISTPGFNTGGWLSVTPDDAGAPGTEIEALLQNGAWPNIFYSDHLRKCFGYVVTATVTPPSGGGAPITVRQSVTVAPHPTQTAPTAAGVCRPGPPLLARTRSLGQCERRSAQP